MRFHGHLMRFRRTATYIAPLTQTPGGL